MPSSAWKKSPSFGKKTNRVPDPMSVSRSVVESLAAMADSPETHEKDEREFREALVTSEPLPEGHSQRIPPRGIELLFTVTTIASSPRRGGTRTVAFFF